MVNNMAYLIDDVDYDEDKRVTSNLFLSSLNTWYPEGKKCKVKRLIRPFNGKTNDYLIIPCIVEILDEMKWCRARELDGNGEVIYEENPLNGNDEISITIIEDAKYVTFYLRLKVELGNTNENELIVNKQSSSYELINSAYISNGILPVGNNKSFITNTQELYEYLNEYHFTAYAGKGDFKGRKYFKLKTNQVTEKDPLRNSIPNYAD